MAVGEETAAYEAAGPVVLSYSDTRKRSLHKKAICLWGMLGALFTVGVMMNTFASPQTAAHVEQLATAAVVVNGGKVVQHASWMATAMEELEKERNHGEQMLAQVRAQAASEESPSKEVKMALADGIATKLEQLRTTKAGKQFLMQVNKEATDKPQWVRMIARQAARNMLLEVIHATKEQVLLDAHAHKRILAPKNDPWQSKPAPELHAKAQHEGLTSSSQSELEELAHDDANVVAKASQHETIAELPKEVSKVSTILDADSTPEKLAVAAHQVNAKGGRKDDDTKVKLPMALEVVHKLTQLAATPEGSDYIKSVRSRLTGRESPKEIDDVTYKVAHTMLKQLVGNVQEDLLVKH